jgi:hypothetical protein
MTEPTSKKSRKDAIPTQISGGHSGKAISEPSLRKELRTTISNLRSYIQTKELSKDTIEIEARLGMLLMDGIGKRWKAHSGESCSGPDFRGDPMCMMCSEDLRKREGLVFLAGVDEGVFEMVSRALPSDTFKSIPPKAQRLRCDDHGNRWEIPLKSSSQSNLKRLENKSSIDKMNIALLSHHYDLRINLSNEISISSTTSIHNTKSNIDSITFDETKWTTERLKRRTSYRKKSGAYWQIDVTEVETWINDQTKTHSSSSSSEEITRPADSLDFEIEIELINEKLDEWLAYDAPYHINNVIADQVIKSMLLLFEVFIVYSIFNLTFNVFYHYIYSCMI